MGFVRWALPCALVLAFSSTSFAQTGQNVEVPEVGSLTQSTTSAPSVASPPPASPGAGADDWAGRYASGSASIVSQTQIFNLNFSGLIVSNGILGGIGLGATARFVFSHFILQPALSFTGFGLPGSGGGSFTFIFTPGVGLGAAFALNSRLALSPMLRSDFYLLPGGTGSVSFGVAVFGELPLTIFFGRNAMIEPYLDVGALIGAFGSASFLVGVGYRLGVVF